MLNVSSGFRFRAVSYMRLCSRPLDGIVKYEQVSPLKICFRDW